LRGRIGSRRRTGNNQYAATATGVMTAAIAAVEVESVTVMVAAAADRQR
jgi:hypothetical protein